MNSIKIPKYAREAGIVAGIACGPKTAREARRMLRVAVEQLKQSDRELGRSNPEARKAQAEAHSGPTVLRPLEVP